MLYPDYNNSLVNLASSVLKYYGAKTNHATLPVLDKFLQKNYKNVVVMLFDGLGVDTLSHHLPEDSFLRKHFQTTITSVFPPTTTAATTSINSGLTPAEHGWLGWSLYFSELDKVINAFTNIIKDSDTPAADYHVADKFLSYKTIYEKITEIGNAAAYNVSKFGNPVISTYEEMFEKIKELCSLDERKYIYSYWEEPDSLMHENGSYAKVVTEYLQKIDKSVEDLCGELTDTLVIVTADHGHINTKYEYVSEHPKLEQMLYRPVSIETRATAFFVKNEYKNSFKDAFLEAFGEGFLLLSQKEIIQRKLFGEGEEHYKFRELTGDFIAIAVSDKGIVQNHNSLQLISNHAGMTEQEMVIPFIAVE